MDDPDCDSTWEEDEEEDGEGPSAGGGGDGEAGAPGDADAEDEDDDEEDARAARPGALQVQPRRALGSQRPRAGLPGRREARLLGSRNWRAVRDTRRYRHHYPDLIEQAGNGDMPNLSFYRNEIRFLPNGCFIEDILQNWREDYDLLEENHSYIQWLFPLREPGVNWHAKPLTLQEIELEDRDTGQVCRAHNYQKRFQNLNW
nr:opioid growth factor receptor-like isoform X4 [Mirounga angustirostris]